MLNKAVAGAEQERPSKAVNTEPSACGAFCPSWLASLFPFPLTQWKGHLLGKFFHSRNSARVLTIGVHMTFGRQHVRIMICSGQNHLSYVYVQCEGHQLRGISVFILLLLPVQLNTEGGDRQERGLDTNGRRSPVRGSLANRAQS